MRVGYFFAQKEYQYNSGNVSHTHMMIEVYWALLTIEQQIFVEDLARACLCDIIRSDEMDTFF